MKNKNANQLSCVTVTVFTALAAAFPASGQFYSRTNLVSDIPGMAKLTDPNLVNPWGVSHSATSPFWVSNAGTNPSGKYAIDSILSQSNHW